MLQYKQFGKLLHNARRRRLSRRFLLFFSFLSIFFFVLFFVRQARPNRDTKREREIDSRREKERERREIAFVPEGNSRPLCICSRIHLCNFHQWKARAINTPSVSLFSLLPFSLALSRRRVSDCLSLQSNCCLVEIVSRRKIKGNHRKEMWRKWAIPDRFNSYHGSRPFSSRLSIYTRTYICIPVIYIDIYVIYTYTYMYIALLYPLGGYISYKYNEQK